MFAHLFFEMAKTVIDCIHLSNFYLGFTEKERGQRNILAQKWSWGWGCSLDWFSFAITLVIERYKNTPVKLSDRGQYDTCKKVDYAVEQLG